MVTLSNATALCYRMNCTVTHDCLPGQYDLRIDHQEAEQFKLLKGEVDLILAGIYRVTFLVHPDIPDTD